MRIQFNSRTNSSCYFFSNYQEWIQENTAYYILRIYLGEMIVCQFVRIKVDDSAKYKLALGFGMPCSISFAA